MRILTGSPIEVGSSPILYKSRGRTKIWVEMVAVANSRSLNLGVINYGFFSIIGETKIKRVLPRKKAETTNQKGKFSDFELS